MLRLCAGEQKADLVLVEVHADHKQGRAALRGGLGVEGVGRGVELIKAPVLLCDALDAQDAAEAPVRKKQAGLLPKLIGRKREPQKLPGRPTTLSTSRRARRRCGARREGGLCSSATSS